MAPFSTKNQKKNTQNFRFRGFPEFPESFFSENFFAKIFIQTSLLFFFSKIPKGGARRQLLANNWGSRFLIFAFLLFFGGQKVQSCSTICQNMSFNACFWIFGKILRNVGVAIFVKKFAKKNFFGVPGIPRN